MTCSGHKPSTVLAALALAAALALSTACSSPVVTWSARAVSPDGRWVATAESLQWSGPGNAYDATTVSLAPANRPKHARQVIQISQQYATIQLCMRWAGPGSLRVAYAPSARAGDHVSLDYQVARLWGVVISAGPLAAPAGGESKARIGRRAKGQVAGPQRRR